MDYKKKYLKYKLKYLYAKNLYGGKQHESENESEEESEELEQESIDVFLIMNDFTEEITVQPGDKIFYSIKIKIPNGQMISRIFFGDEVIYDYLVSDDYNSTFQDYDIEDGARLSIETKDITVLDIIREIEQMNDITIRDTINVNYINEDKDPLHIVQLHLSNSNIRILPISFCYLKIQNHLSLQDNQLTSLPEAFGLIKIGGHIRLHHNQLTSLPESFSSINIEGSLYLNDNQLTSLPESFSSINVEGSV